MTRKIILDCDPGHDDAVAILLAALLAAVLVLLVQPLFGGRKRAIWTSPDRGFR